MTCGDRGGTRGLQALAKSRMFKEETRPGLPGRDLAVIYGGGVA